MFNVYVVDSLCGRIINLVMLSLMDGPTDEPVVVFSSSTAEPSSSTKNENRWTPEFCKHVEHVSKHVFGTRVLSRSRRIDDTAGTVRVPNECY